MNVLIIEADDKFRNQLARRLSAMGFQVVVTDDMEDARRMAELDAPPAILLGVSGFRPQALSFLEMLVAHCPGSRVICINQSGDMALSMAAMKLGAVDEITAPVDMAELVAKLRAVENGGAAR